MSSRSEFITTTHKSTYPFISPANYELSGRYILITGAGFENGVGYATALAHARAGASGIALVDLHGIPQQMLSNLVSAAVSAGRPEPLVKGYECDISDISSVGTMRDRFMRDFGNRIDVVINNAAVQEPMGTILDGAHQQYWRTWEVNVRGLFNMAETFIPFLLGHRDDRGGLSTMLNVASSGGLEPRAGGASYRTSKLAVIRWTENIALDHGHQGLLTYCVNPGAIKTDITNHLPSELRDRLPHNPNIAGDTITWLCSERREWLAGRYVSCPWDMKEFLSRKDEIVSGDKLKMRLVV